MKNKTGLALSVISFGALVVACILSGPLVVSAQGWRAGAAKAKSATKIHKSARAAKTNASVAGAKEPKANASGPKTTTVETKASRDRLVNQNKNADAKGTSVGALANKSEPKNAVSTRVAASSNARSGRCDPDRDERIDLSGTYTGNVKYPNGGLSGDATLTVTGNRFTLRNGAKTESGNITAVTTCTYTAVAMMFGEWRTPKPGEPAAPPLPMLSLTATRQGDQLTLKSSPSERREFSFAPAGKK